MRALLWVTCVLAALWGGYWVVGSRAALSGAEAWLAESGAEYEAVTVAGFPNRFDVTVTGISARDAASGLGWQAPFVQVFAMSWKPWHLIAALPNDQVIILPDQKVDLASTRMMGSLLLVPGADLALSETVVEGEGLVLLSSLGWKVAADKAVVSTRATGRENDHRFGLAVTGIRPDALAQDAGLPAVIEAVRVDADLGFSAPLNRNAVQTQPQVISVDLHEARVDWGDLGLVAQGKVAPDGAGFAAGELALQVTGWRALPGMLRGLGLIDAEFEPRLMQGLALLSGGQDSVSVTLAARDGQMFMGPLPLGPAPYFGSFSTN